MRTRRCAVNGAGRVGLLVSLLLIAAGAWYVVTHGPKGPAARIQKENQSDPESALRFYLQTAYKLIHNEQPGGTLADVALTVTQDDWKWFEENNQTLFSKMDALGAGKVVGADQKAVLSKYEVLHTIYDMGPDHPSNEIINRQICPDRAIFTVRKRGMDQASYQDFQVEVVKEGPYWKVKDFAGARSALAGGR